MPDTVSQAEAAAILGVSEHRIAKYRVTGRLAFQKAPNGGIRILKAHALALAACVAPKPKPVRMSRDAAELPPNLLKPFLPAALAVA